MVCFIYFLQIIQAPTKPKGEPMTPFVAMGWFHPVFVLILLNIHKICLKLTSGFRIIHKYPTQVPHVRNPIGFDNIHGPKAKNGSAAPRHILDVKLF
jgi:hypothetical protein